METVACVGLGSNLGDRQSSLNRAVHEIRGLEGVTRVIVSSFRDTAPVGGPDQPDFLNGAVAFRTRLSPRVLLDRLMEIERGMGRVRTTKWGPRIIDLDLLLYGDEVIDEFDLRIPHPRMCERPFVLVPLAELVPRMRHPVEAVTVGELLHRLEPTVEPRRP